MIHSVELSSEDISSKLGVIFRGTTIPNGLKNYYFLNRESHKVTCSKYYEEMCPLLFANHSQAINTIYKTISEKYPHVQYYKDLIGRCKLEDMDKREVYLELLRNCPQAQYFIMFHKPENLDTLKKNMIKEATIFKWKHIRCESVTINRDIYQKLAFWWGLNSSEDDIFQESDSISVSLFLFWVKSQNMDLTPEEFVPYIRTIYDVAEELADNFDVSLYHFALFPNYEPLKFEYATYFFNENTRTLLVHQNLEKFREMPHMASSRVMFLTWKQWLIANIPIIHQRSFMLFSSASLYFLGLRPCRDIDIMISGHLPEIYDEGIQHYLVNEKTKFPQFDISKPGMGEWDSNSYKNNWFGHEWPQTFGAQSIDDVIFNPRFHAYFMGVKMVCLEGDIKRRISRSRPSSMADIYVLKNMWDYFIPQLEIPKQCWENNQLVSYDTVPRMAYFLKKICTYLKRNYRISLPVEDLFDFLNVSPSIGQEISKYISDDANHVFSFSPISEKSITISNNVDFDDSNEYI